MSYYEPNPACRCGRCSTRGLMGPAVLVTLGLLFLLANLSNYPLQRTWPILLIVIGAIRLVRYVVPESGHVNPGQYRSAYAGQGSSPGSYQPSPHRPSAALEAAPRQSGVQSDGENGAQSEAPASGLLVTPPPAPMAGALSDGHGGGADLHDAELHDAELHDAGLHGGEVHNG